MKTIESLTNEEVYRAFFDELKKKEAAEYNLKIIIAEIEKRQAQEVATPVEQAAATPA